ncbi:MAG: ABC transporter ATP-binding protein, partial [Nitrospirae bacterium]
MLEIEDVRVRQAAFMLSVKKIKLSPGEIIAVLGNNGSGKSTFLLLLSGLRAFTGLYMINHTNFKDLRTEDRSRLISLLPQSTTLNMPFDVFYVVLTGRFPHTENGRYSKEDRELTEKVMYELDIMHLKDRPFNELSGGEKQRVLFARVMNSQTPIILLDEPLN